MTNKYSDYDERLRKVEIDTEKLLTITDNIQKNYLDMYEEMKKYRETLSSLSVNIKEIKTNLEWVVKIKNISVISGSIVAGVSGLYYFMKEYINK